ncbi:MFS transporter [Salinibius halmophilus]|uniref:MFS transporter n=1 Tax=Salinibius halmophilus TaxID=1853216 RepID=UPI000E675077|nr:MFS transporter [Salinibius halmophilus]
MDFNRASTAVSGFNKWVGWWLLLVVFISGFFFRFAPSTLSLSMQQELNLSATALGLVASMHFWIYTFMQVPSGALADKFGTRNSALLGGGVTTAGALCFGLASNLPWLLAGTALMGLGLAAIFVALMRYNTQWFSRHTLVLSATMLFAALGSVIAQSPTAQLLIWFSWREIVLFFTVLILIASLLMVRFLTAGPPAQQRVAQGDNWAVLKNKQIWLLFVCVAATNGTLYAFLGLWAIPLIVDGFQVSATLAAQYSTTALIVYGLGSLLWGWVGERVGAHKPVILATAVLAAVTWAVLTYSNWSLGWPGMALFLLLGLSGGPVGVIFAAAKDAAPPQNVGFAIALVNMGAFLIAAIVQTGMGVILDVTSPTPQLGDYQLALQLPFFVSVLGVAAALMLPGRSS